MKLVDVKKAPIECITEKGVKLQDGAEYEFDIIIYATGFDAVSGPLTRMDIRGEGGQTFKDKWADGPRSYFGYPGALASRISSSPMPPRSATSPAAPR